MRGRGEDEMMTYLRRHLADVERDAIVELTLHPNRWTPTIKVLTL
jgi:hypothetical protein